MRLGQGFNSYNQQICLDNAVLIDTDHNRLRVKGYYEEDAKNGNTKDVLLPNRGHGGVARDPNLDNSSLVDGSCTYFRIEKCESEKGN